MNPVLAFFAPRPSAPPIGDAGEIDREYRRQRPRVFITLTAIYSFYYVCRLGLSVMKKDIIDEGIWTAAELGTIGAWFQYSYGFGKLCNGFLADRVNIARFIPLGLVLSAAANFAMGSSSGVAIATGVWAFNGIVQGIGAPACVVSITQWFGGRERGTMYGLWSAAHGFGEGLTFVVTAGLVASAGWRAGFYGAGVVCVVVAVAAAFMLKDRPETLGLPPVRVWRGEPEPPARDHSTTQWAAQLSVLKMPAVWILGTSSALMYMTRYAINSWGVLYLQEQHKYSLVEAGAIVGVNAIAGVFGSIAYGFISDRFFGSRRPPVTFIFGVVEVASLFMIFFAEDMLMLKIGFVLYGFTLSGLLAVLGGLMAVDITPKKATGVAMGFVGVFSYIGAGLQESISGNLIQTGTTVVDGVKHYDFSQAVTFWIAASVASLMLATTLWRVRERA